MHQHVWFPNGEDLKTFYAVHRPMSPDSSVT